MDEELDYISSSPMTRAIKREVKPQDELDMPTLEKVLLSIDRKIDFHNSLDSLSVSENILSVKEQLAVNQTVVTHLRELKLLVETTINNVKEKYKDE
jgi:hypothetical protein